MTDGIPDPPPGPRDIKNDGMAELRYFFGCAMAIFAIGVAVGIVIIALAVLFRGWQ